MFQWFSRNGGSDKERTVVAKANIDRSNDQVLLRQGSLRMPQASPASMSPLVRYGSLRAPTYSSSIDHTKLMLDALDKRFNAKLVSFKFDYYKVECSDPQRILK